MEVYKILQNVYDPEITKGMLYLSSNTRTRGHSLKLCAQPARLDVRKYSFAIRVVKPWNSLPEEVIMSSSIKMFEARLDKFWKDQPMKNSYVSKLKIWTKGSNFLRPAIYDDDDDDGSECG